MLAARRQREFPFPHCFRRESEAFGDILSFESRIHVQEFVGGHAVGDHVQHDGDRDSETPDTGDTSHLICSDRDARKRHGVDLAWRSKRACLARRGRTQWLQQAGTRIPGESLTFKEVAALKVAEETIYAMAQAGEVPAFKIFGWRRINRTELHQWIEAQPRGGEEGWNGQ